MRPIQAQDIVRWGFFRRELPPAFVSHTLANHLVQMQPHGDPKVTHLCSFNVPNGRTARRKLSICHPKSFVELATLLADNLATLETHFAKSSLSASLPSLEVEDYPIFTTLATPPQDLSLSTRDLKRLEAATGMKFAIKTDISKFYPTIYTHSVVWALKGKPWAKAWIRSRRRTEEFATELDSALQNCQDRQTIGIPIGPFTSRIVSEIIGTAIDSMLDERISDARIVRFGDDYWIFAPTQPIAEAAFAHLRLALSSFELEVNEAKTSRYSLPEPIDARWVLEIRKLEYSDDPRRQSKNLKDGFSMALHLAQENPNAAVMKYWLKQLKGVNLDDGNLKLFQQLLWQAAIADTSCLGLAAALLNEKLEPHQRDRDIAIETLSTTILDAAVKLHIYEIIWSLWIAATWELELPAHVNRKIEKIEHPLVAITALHYRDSTREDIISTALWRDKMRREELYTENWLLVYEAATKGWLPMADNFNFATAGEWFSQLQELGCTFYYVDRGMEEIFDRDVTMES